MSNATGIVVHFALTCLIAKVIKIEHTHTLCMHGMHMYNYNHLK